MDYRVVAEVEIEDTKISHYSSIILRQRFNEHHEFVIRIKLDVLEEYGSFSLDNTKKLIGKPAIIRLLKMADSFDVAYEFKGVICEIGIEQADSFLGELVLKGYSPTIMIENGPNLTSFYKQNLEKVLKKVTKPLSDNDCTVNFNVQHTKEIVYLCQYKESSFHFLNRLCAAYSEWCYYDGVGLNIGKPDSPPEIEITYGEDVNRIQLALRILPMSFSNYSYISKDDKFESVAAPDNVNGLDEYASHALKESQNVFSNAVSIPIRQRIANKSELEDFVKKEKAAKAADLEVLTGRSDNPHICIGAVAAVSISKREAGDLFLKEDYGKFLITGVTHHLTDNGRYHNTFEAIPSGLEVMPVKNIMLPIAEPQIATVKDNKDPDNMGRVRVQMLWQQTDNLLTDWLRVMTPDAGGGKDGAKNRGLVVVPEPGDQVLICFRYNDPDRPFVLGSMFHGKTGGGGGQGNNTKSLNSKSGHTISLDDGKGITIVDKSGGNMIVVDGTNTITITASQKIELTNGKSSITMDGDTITISADNVITMSAVHVSVDGSTDSAFQSGEMGLTAASAGDVTVNGKTTTVVGSKEVTATGAKATLNGDTEATVNGGGKTTISAGGKVAVQGAIVALN
jgi:type VI secretion system secreted protein VgrG